MKAPKFVLLASGHVVTPRLDIMLRSDQIEAARKQAQEIAAQLSKAGYFSFSVFEIEDGADKFVEAYRAEVVDPIITISR